ncbi:elongation factor P 5-aminopentanone reductase [Exiguobacterium undae]|jgi:3-oxoacyl-[acyl-carrier protein] reductase|uniref:Short-chain dehydrogenase n=1 Tax=Exiguobacterium undae TaxID=169177 RepID=A0ABX2VCS2_9BACL|nr:SDR family oxidoreductase [Exiguobacterium undae]OAN15936.1 short-chain dehydrogenase [Exiguobacterium undae]
MRILITGASGAIGWATVKRLAEDGHELVLHTHQRKTELEQLVKQLPVTTEIVTGDLSDRSALAAFCETLPSVEGFIHIAGTSFSGLLVDQTVRSAEAMLTLHVESLIQIAQVLTRKKAFSAPLSIVVVSSVLGETGVAGEVVYSTCKAAQLGFVKSYSKELGAMHGRVNAVTPGWIDTPMNAVFSEEDRELALAEIPAGRFGRVEEVASAIVYLMSRESEYMNGAVLKIDGAWM